MRGRPRKIDSQKINAARELKANELADMIIEQHLTIRQVAEKTGMSKSTVHKYLKKYIDSPSEQKDLTSVLKSNFNEKHLRGGEATKQKYAKIRLSKENKK